MRRSFLLLAGLLGLGLTACENSPSSTAPVSDNSGAFAMRVPAAVVTAGTGIVDSVTVRVVPLNPVGPAIVKTWPLREEELLFESLPVARCSIYVTLPKKDKSGNAYIGAALVDVRPGRTTQADITLTQTTGSLSLNVKIDAYNSTTATPNVSPAAGIYATSASITLTHPVVGTILQYRLENASLGSTAAWTRYTAPFTINQTSVLYVRAINGTDTGAFKTSNYFITTATILNNFETAYAGPTGWNGTVYKVSTTALSSVGGARVASGPWGNASARLSFVLDGVNWMAVAGATFNSPSINWTSLKAVRIKLRSNISRTVIVGIRASLPSYAYAMTIGGLYSKNLAVTTSSNEFVIPAAEFATPVWFNKPADFPTLSAILPTVTGIGVEIECPNPTNTGTCTNQAGTVDIDDIIVELN
jgi:hypothetical protein